MFREYEFKAHELQIPIGEPHPIDVYQLDWVGNKGPISNKTHIIVEPDLTEPDPLMPELNGRKPELVEIHLAGHHFAVLPASTEQPFGEVIIYNNGSSENTTTIPLSPETPKIMLPFLMPGSPIRAVVIENRLTDQEIQAREQVERVKQEQESYRRVTAQMREDYYASKPRQDPD